MTQKHAAEVINNIRKGSRASNNSPQQSKHMAVNVKQQISATNT